MTELEYFEKIIRDKTPGPWHVGWTDENLDRSDIESEDGRVICESTNRRDEAFICNMGNLAPLLFDVVEAASVPDDVELWSAFVALKGELREMMK